MVASSVQNRLDKAGKEVMVQIQLSPELSASLASVNIPRVQEIIRELAEHGLAVAMPHLHEGGIVRSLPANLVQYENDLQVSFRDRETFEQARQTAFPVMWRLNTLTGQVEPCAWCHDT